jgi:hypothetical protein
MKKEKRYRLEVSETQLRMIADCVEDCHRFMAGQTELQNCTAMLDNRNHLHDVLRKEAYPLVVPELYRKYGINASYDWAGTHCPNEHQRKFIAQSYYLYREILHFFATSKGWDNVYSSATITCADSGEPIKIEEI